MNPAHDWLVDLVRNADANTEYDYHQTQRATMGGDTGEIRLFRAVLTDALEAVRGWPRAGLYVRRERCKESQTQFETNRRRTIREAWLWFESDNDWDVFSFVNICGYLGLEPEAVRKAVKKKLDK